ncbi:MAG TPA: hypothetical protein VEI97_01300, partial [bacterium]|nr:hypothetical protein [bacterium]
MEDYYGLLGLSRWASPEQIERAYAAWERGFGEGKEEELTQREREAYEVLRDPVRRAAYHAELDGLGKEPVKKAGEHPRTGVGTGGGKAVTVQEAPQADPGKAAERERYVRQLEAELATYRAQPAAEEAEGWFGRGGRIWWVLGVAAVALLVGGWWLWGRGPAGNGPVPTLAVAHSYATPEDLLTKVQGDLEAGRCAEVIMEVDLFLRAPDFPLGGSPLAELIYLRAAAKAALRNDTGAVRDYTRAIEIDPNGQ